MKALLLVLAGLMVACRSTPELTPLPKVDLAGFQPAVRKVLESANRDATRLGSADAVAKLGMTYHVHDQFAAAAKCYERAHLLDPKKFDYLYYWGAALASDGKYDEASAKLAEALALDPSSIPGLLRLGDTLISAGRTADANGKFKDALARSENLPAAKFGLARTTNGAEAIRNLESALAAFPRYGAAQFALAQAYRKAGKTTEADRLMQSYAQDRLVTPPLDDPLMDAVSELNVSATGLLRRAQREERAGRLVEAAALCEEAVKESPSLDQGWINLISLYGRLGRADDLERAYRRAVAVAPNRADAYYNYGVFCLSKQRWSDAAKAFERTVALDPRYAEAWSNLGMIQEQNGDIKTAAMSFGRAVDAKPDFRLARFHLGRIYANQRRFPEAIAQFEKTLEPKDDQTPTYMYALAATYARSGNRTLSRELMVQARNDASGRNQTGLVESIERDLKALDNAR